MKPIYQSLSMVLLGCLLFFSSCIDEDTSNCFVDNNLLIRFSDGLPEDARTHYLPTDCRLADVFIFDQEGIFVSRLSDKRFVFTTDYSLSTQLPIGNYTFVSWLNLQSCYEIEPDEFIPGETRFDDAFLHFSRNVQEIETVPEALFYGSLTDVTITGRKQEITIPVIPDNYRVNFTVTGPLDSQHYYQFGIRATNGTYTFDNSFAPCGEHFYNRFTRTNEENKLISGHTLMRLARGRTPEFTITNLNTDLCLYRYNLIDLILELEKIRAEVDFSKEYIFDIEIDLKGQYEYANMDATVTINGWKLYDQGSPLE